MESSNCFDLSNEPDPDAVRSQLARIVGSADFNVPQRAKSFLRYIVEEKLSGREKRIKAFTIANEVFGRDKDFDAMNDPVVRIEAARLRRALERYYLLEGKGDPMVIQVAKGTYVPEFQWRHIDRPVLAQGEPLENSRQSRSLKPAELMAHPGVMACGLACAVALSLTAIVFATRPQVTSRFPVSALAREPQVTVKPFVSLSPTSESLTLAAALSEEVLTRLAMQKRVQVFAEPAGSLAGDLGEKAASRYAVEGSIRQSADRWRIITRLIDARTTAVKWTISTDSELRSGSRVDALAAELSDLVTLQLERAMSPSKASARAAGSRPHPLSDGDARAWP